MGTACELACGLPVFGNLLCPCLSGAGCGNFGGPARGGCSGGNCSGGACSGGHGEHGCRPCWLPCELAPIEAEICPDSAVRVRFHVVNNSLVTRTFIVAATGRDARLAKGAPSTVTVDPMSRGELAAVIRVPFRGEGHHHRLVELTLWVRGCADFVVPVRLRPGADEGCGFTIVRHIVDQPDTCHTWQDHFAVSRTCASTPNNG